MPDAERGARPLEITVPRHVVDRNPPGHSLGQRRGEPLAGTVALLLVRVVLHRAEEQGNAASRRASVDSFDHAAPPVCALAGEQADDLWIVRQLAVRLP